MLALVVCGPCCLGLVLCLADSDHSSNGYAGMALYVASRSRRYPTLAPSRASLCARSDRRAGCVTQAGVWRAVFSHLRVRARERRGFASRDAAPRNGARASSVLMCIVTAITVGVVLAESTLCCL